MADQLRDMIYFPKSGLFETFLGTVENMGDSTSTRRSGFDRTRIWAWSVDSAEHALRTGSTEKLAVGTPREAIRS